MGSAGSPGIITGTRRVEGTGCIYSMTDAGLVIEWLLDEGADAKMKTALARMKVYASAEEAAASVPRSGWQDWRKVGVQFSRFHRPATQFALPFSPDDYLWAGPFTLKMSEYDLKIGQEFRIGYYQRAVKKYMRMLARGLKLPPVALLYHDAWGWSMQDGNHRYEALVRAGALTYDAFLGKPKFRKPDDTF